MNKKNVNFSKVSETISTITMSKRVSVDRYGVKVILTDEVLYNKDLHIFIINQLVKANFTKIKEYEDYTSGLVYLTCNF